MFKKLNNLIFFSNFKLKISSYCVCCLLFALAAFDAVICYLCINRPVYALMRSNDYELQMPNLNFTSGNVSSTDYQLGFTGGQNTSGSYSDVGYRALIGFWYLKTIIPFSFSLSNQIIEFGSLSSGVPSYGTTTLVVSSGGAGAYQVTATESRPLRVDSTGAAIPDVTGDNGLASESVSDDWLLNTTYGFGYTMHGNDVPSPFPTSAPAGTSYKQFANLETDEAPQVVMSSVNVGKNRSAVMTYKVNISSVQPAGRYRNNIIFVATPGY